MNALKAGDTVRATRDIPWASKPFPKGHEGRVTAVTTRSRYWVLFNDVTVLVYADEIEPAGVTP